MGRLSAFAVTIKNVKIHRSRITQNALYLRLIFSI